MLNKIKFIINIHSQKIMLTKKLLSHNFMGNQPCLQLFINIKLLNIILLDIICLSFFYLITLSVHF